MVEGAARRPDISAERRSTRERRVRGNRRSPVITSSEVRDRPLHVITDRCIPMRTNPTTYPPHIPSHPQPSAGIYSQYM